MFNKKKLIIIAACMIFISPLQALPATHAYLSIPTLNALAQGAWEKEIAMYEDIIQQAMLKEHELGATHHVFYHAQTCHLRIVQDFIKELYCFLYPTVSVHDFHFLRAWYEFPVTIDANTFVDTHENGVPKNWDDNTSTLVKKMLSVNYSLFGSTQNFGTFGECSFKYFFDNKSVKMKPHQIEGLIHTIFSHFGFSAKHIAELMTIGKIIETQEGSLFQIFIPKEFVDKIGFTAQRLGTPYRMPIVSDYFDSLKQRHTALTPILDAYTQYPGSISDVMDRLQGRLLFSQDVLLNPQCGVIIIRYTTINPAVLQQYEVQLKKYTQSLFKKWLKKVSKKVTAYNDPITPELVAHLKQYYGI